ncbi:MAG: hypothetical protein Tsb0015_00840 [Simkaniaceae bacterium]
MAQSTQPAAPNFLFHKAIAAFPETLSRDFGKFLAKKIQKNPFALENDIFKDFSLKRNIHIHDPKNYKEHIVVYTYIFRDLFPEIKVEAAQHHHAFKLHHPNSFKVQWKLIQNYLFSNKNNLQECLEKILCHEDHSEEKIQRVKALLEGGASISYESAKKMLTDPKPVYYQMLLSHGYSLNHKDFYTLGDSVHCLSILKCLKERGHEFSEDERFLILSRRISKEIIITICPDGISSSLFQRLFPQAQTLLLFGYQPTQKDLLAAIKEKNLEVTELIFHHGYKPNGLEFQRLYTLEEPQRKNFLSTFIKFGYQITKEDFQIALNLIGFLEKDWRKTSYIPNRDSYLFIRQLLLNDIYEERLIPHTLFTEHKNFQGGGFKNIITREELLHCLEIEISPPILEMIAAFIPVKKEDILLAIKKNYPGSLIKFLMEKEHLKITKADFRTILTNKCSFDNLRIILHFGFDKENSSPYPHRVCHTKDCMRSFHNDNAGYLPDQEDLSFARQSGCNQEMLDLIANRMKNKS